MSGDGLVASLAAAQAEMPVIEKTHTNPHFKNKYADIADVLGVVRPVLARHGIALVQPIETDADGSVLVTRLLKGDEVIESRLPLQIDAKAQDLGGRLTYLRRFQLCALVGVAAEDDDDGATASAAPVRTRPQRRSQSEPEPTQPVLAQEHVQAVTDWFDGLPDEERKTRKQAFVAEFGPPTQVEASKWPAVEKWMQA